MAYKQTYIIDGFQVKYEEKKKKTEHKFRDTYL